MWIGSRPYRTRKRSHVIAFELFHKRRVRDGLVICHCCDYPLCCNPLHLWEGTSKENFQDMFRKNRNKSQIGVAAHTPEVEAKRNLTFKKILHQKEHRNSQFGTMWVKHVQLKQSIKIYPNQLKEMLAEGWEPGRKIYW